MGVDNNPMISLNEREARGVFGLLLFKEGKKP
jgi:hypothetical protein